MFDVKKIKAECVEWIRGYFAENGPDCNAVVGISGGKDSSVVAALCVEALGVDRVIGVLMPNGEQADISASYMLVNHLGIRYHVVNIQEAYNGVLNAIGDQFPIDDWVGYATRYGDGAGDFSPLSRLTVQEVKALGRELGLPEALVEKVPIDGLCGKTDEDNLGFTYAVLDRYIRTGEIDDPATKAKIDRMHALNLYKLRMMPAFEPEI